MFFRHSFRCPSIVGKQTKFGAMMHIIRMGNIFQIIRPVISLNAIFMVNVIPFWPCTNKGQYNKSMNKHTSIFRLISKANAVISFLFFNWDYDSLFPRTSSICVSSYSTKVRNRINTIKDWYYSPFFIINFFLAKLCGISLVRHLSLLSGSVFRPLGKLQLLSWPFLYYITKQTNMQSSLKWVWKNR